MCSPVAIHATVETGPSLFLVQLRGERDGKVVDAKCHNMTASFVRQRQEVDPSITLCGFYEKFDRQGKDNPIPNGVYNLVGEW